MLTARILAFGVVLGVGGATALSQTPPPPPSPPATATSAGDARVTTDTAEYCDALAERVIRAEKGSPDAAREAGQLAEEGHHMCAAGLIRGGLVRLRRALLMLRTDK